MRALGGRQGWTRHSKLAMTSPVARIDYDEQTAAAFKASREIPRDGLWEWRDAVRRHLQPSPGMTLVDIGASYAVAKNVDLYGSIQNLFNTTYLAQGYTLTSFQGSTVSTTSIPALGMPLWATVGLRARF